MIVYNDGDSNVCEVLGFARKHDVRTRRWIAVKNENSVFVRNMAIVFRIGMDILF